MVDAKKTESENDNTSPIRVLIIDNDKHHAQAMSEILERVGYDCIQATSGPEGAIKIDQHNYDVVITDLMMNDIDGMQVLSRAKESLPNCEVIMVTGHGTIPKAVEAMQKGAFTFIEKPIHADGLRAATEKAADAVRLRQTNLDLHKRLDEKFGFDRIIYTSTEMQAVIDRLKRIAPTEARVLITGQNGTGKELVAQAIHQNSPRKKKRFVAVNFAALSEHLLESELFGHIRGAYTDASTDRVGRFEYVDGGTLFLDEVGDMPMPTQIKLLRVLESGEITRVGENKHFKVNVRVLSATNRDLEQAVAAGTFREDLYHRLKVVTIALPRLAERRDDIVPLLDQFRKEFSKQYGKSIKSVSPEVIKRLFAYDWPGNIRQLRNFVETMVVLDTDDLLDIDDLPPELAEVEMAVENSAQSGPWDLIGQSMEQIECWAIKETLKLANGNREEAARLLKIGARTLYRKIKEYELN
ncbi:MAG: sigma-54-dependent Fis family transcriptional regulator [Planctomycetaceae bacterium]|nr:sigma-54-dependent Fis family transcriptional regulator [Planctomycetaceae bacterium]MBP62467.1 sigma-54-dependent Fis family transcriptional regulator [Planctomycetaceae bacterium]